MIRYIEQKSGSGDDGPAWIARVRASRTGRTLYFNGRALKRSQGISGNHRDIDPLPETDPSAFVAIENTPLGDLD